MKKIFLSIVCIVYGISCLAQKIALSSKINITPPHGLVELNSKQFSANGADQFRQSKTAADNIIRSVQLANDNTSFYRFEDVFVSLVHGDKPEEPNYLEDIKGGLDEMSKKIKSSTHYSSELKNVNNNHVLITYDDWQNVGYYNFYCWNNDYTQSVNGRFQFIMTDKNKATKVLNDLLSSLEFKK